MDNYPLIPEPLGWATPRFEIRSSGSTQPQRL